MWRARRVVPHAFRSRCNSRMLTPPGSGAGSFAPGGCTAFFSHPNSRMLTSSGSGLLAGNVYAYNLLAELAAGDAADLDPQFGSYSLLLTPLHSLLLSTLLFSFLLFTTPFPSPLLSSSTGQGSISTLTQVRFMSGGERALDGCKSPRTSRRRDFILLQPSPP